MAGTGAGKGSRPRKVDIKKYGEHFDAIFSKNRKSTVRASGGRINSQLINCLWFCSQMLTTNWYRKKVIGQVSDNLFLFSDTQGEMIFGK